MLLSSTYMKSKSFQLLILPCERGSWGCTNSWEARTTLELGSAQPRQLTQTDQRVNSYHMVLFMLNNNTGVVGWWRGCSHCSGSGWTAGGWWANALCITCSVYYYFFTLIIIVIIFPSFPVLLSFYLNAWVLFFSDSCPHLTGRGVNECVYGA